MGSKSVRAMLTNRRMRMMKNIPIPSSSSSVTVSVQRYKCSGCGKITWYKTGRCSVCEGELVQLS